MTHLRWTDPVPVWVIVFSWQRPNETSLSRCPRTGFFFFPHMFLYLIPHALFVDLLVQKEEKKKKCWPLAFIKDEMCSERECFWIPASPTHIMKQYWIGLNVHAFTRQRDYISSPRLLRSVLIFFQWTKTSCEFLPSAVSLNKYQVTLLSWRPASHRGAGFNWLIVHMVGIFVGIARGWTTSHQQLLLVENLKSKASNWKDRVLIDV